MIQKEKIDGYSVIGYDKDNDVFICYGKFEVLHDAVNRAKELAKQIANGALKRKCSDGSEEPIDWIEIYCDWIEIYWNWNEDDERIIWGSD